MRANTETSRSSARAGAPTTLSIILQEKPLVLVESEIKGNDYTWFDPKPN